MGNSAKVARAETRATTALREWFGWFGVLAWMFCMFNGYENLPGSYSDDAIFWYVVAFQVVFALSAAAVGFRFGRDPDGLGRLAFYTAPAAVVITAVFTFLPQPWGSALYAVSPAFLAPAIARRAYGVMRTARPGHTVFAYTSGVAAGFGAMVFYFNSDLPYETVPAAVSYIIFAFFAFLAWFGVRRSIEITGSAPGAVGRGFSAAMVLRIAAVVLAAFWLRKMNDLIDFAVEQYDDFLFFPVYTLLPPVSYLLFGFIADRRRERGGILSGLMLFLISIQLAFLASRPQSPAAIPLVFINHFIGVYLVYFLITLTLPFHASAKRPVFSASLGIAVYITSRTFNLIMSAALPQSVKIAGVPLFVSTALSSIVFFALSMFILYRHREKTLAAALYALLEESGGATEDGEPPEITGMPEASVTGLTDEEKAAARLLLDGLTPHEISRRLHLPSTDAGALVRAVREKVLGAEQAGIVGMFHLTPREAEVLGCLRASMTNNEIVEALHLSEGAVKVHVHNLMQKLPVGNRKEVPAWAKKFEQEIGQ